MSQSTSTSHRNPRLLLVILLSLSGLLALGAGPANAATMTCSLTGSATGPFSASFYGTMSGGTAPYSWSLSFGDGGSTSGTGSVVSASHVYSSAGAYTAVLSASGSGSFTAPPPTCGASTDVTVSGAVTVAATVTEGFGLSESSASSPAKVVSETISVAERAIPVAASIVKEVVNLVESTASSISTAASGIPEYPFQTWAVLAVTIALVAAYFIARRQR